MKKYILSGLAGFLIHAALILGSGALFLNEKNPLDLMSFYGNTKSIFAAFLYALLFSVLFSSVILILFKTTKKYTFKEKLFASISSGIGFLLAFWGLILFFWWAFKDFQLL